MNRYLWGLGQFLCSLAGPVSPFPDGFFYAVRNQLGGVTGWAQLIRIETNGTVEEIAPLWGDDGIPKLTGGYTLAWHSFYRRLFAYKFFCERPARFPNFRKNAVDTGRGATLRPGRRTG